MCACASDLRAQPPARSAAPLLQNHCRKSVGCCAAADAGVEVLVFSICGLLHLCARISCSCVRVQQLEISTLAPPYSDTLRTRLRTPCALLSHRFSGRFSRATTMAASCLLVTACTLTSRCRLRSTNACTRTSGPVAWHGVLPRPGAIFSSGNFT